jgi:mono/diheme cytochrome c family protein
MSKYRWWGLLIVTSCLAMWLAACNGMEEQPKYEPYEPSTFFRDGTSARPLVPNTVARGQLEADTLLYAGQENGAQATEFPFPVTAEVLARGQQRYNIYCTPCHGYAGYGDGIIVQRGLTPPPSFHQDRLRAAPVGHIFDVITDGIGAMYSYGSRVQPEDRWAIVAYVRALQMSQNATYNDLPADVQQQLQAQPEATPGTPVEEESNND